MKIVLRNAIISIGLTIVSAVLVPVSVAADTVFGIYLSASSWGPDLSGNISNAGAPIDLQDVLDIKDEHSSLFSLAVEHPVALLPNVKVQKTELDTLSSSMLGSEISFGGVTFPVGSSLRSQIILSHTDYILYYEVFDNWISLDLGIALMKFNGKINLQTDSLISENYLKDVVPAGYAKLNFDLPTTDLFIGAEGAVLSFSDSSITDYKVYVGYESEIGLGAEIGYHSFEADWQDFDSSNGDITFDGYYASVLFHF